MEAYHTVWNALNSQLQARCHTNSTHHLHTQAQEVLDGLLSSTFAQLTDAIRDGHSRITTRLEQQVHAAIPAALVATGGGSDADHATTFAKLAQHLQQQGMRTALLRPQDVSGKGVAPAVNRMLRQFSGLDTPASDMQVQPLDAQQFHTVADTLQRTHIMFLAQACKAWYADLTNDDTAPPAKSPRTEHATSPRDARATRAATMLATLHVATTTHNAPPSNAVETELPPTAPLVVILQRAEAVDIASLHTLFSLLHECIHTLPVTLVMGMGTSPTCFLRDLPVDCASLLHPTHHTLHKASRSYEEIVAGVVLGKQWPGVMLGAGAIDVVHRQFVYHDFSAAAVCKGLQVACMQHFMTQRGSVLAGALLQGGPSAAQRVFDALPSPARRHLLQELHLPSGVRVKGHLTAVLRAWAGWAVVLHWIAEAGATATAHLGMCLGARTP